jgi:hypothetical protein
VASRRVQCCSLSRTKPAERLKNRSNDVMSPRNWQENPAFTKVNELRLGEAVVFRGRSGIALAMK